MRTNVPIAVRMLRRRHRLRQVDLAARAGIGRDSVSRVETGRLDGMTIGSLERAVGALGATLVVEVRWQGADLDRIIDRAHAHLTDGAARRLARNGWIVRAEVSFNHYGDRGSCDLVAWHAPTRTMLIVEMKSPIGDVQETLRRLDVKARLGSVLARQLELPAPASVVRALVLADDRTSRRTLAAHAAVFAAFAPRGRSALAWLRAPVGRPDAVLWFEQPADSDGAGTLRASRVSRRGSAG